MKISDRTIMMRNNYLRFLGNMSAQEVDNKRMQSAGEELDAKLNALMEDYANKGQDDLKVIPDLLNLKVLADKNRFTDDIRQVLGMSLAVSDNVLALSELGFDAPNSFGAFNVASAQISIIAKKVALKLYHNLVDAMKDPSSDDLVVDIIYDAIIDQISERATYIKFCQTHGVAYDPSEETEEEHKKNYIDAFDEWLNGIAGDILVRIMANPGENTLILPVGMDEVREVLFEICPPEANEWIIELSYDEIYGGAMFDKLINEYKLDREALNKFAVVIDRFIQDNSVNQAVELGQGQSVRPLYSVNIGAVILHAMIQASAALWSEEEELDESTEYIVDLFRQELLNVETIEYDADKTPYKLLSVVSTINNIIVSRSAYMRASSQDYIMAQGAIVFAITNELHEETIDDMNIDFAGGQQDGTNN